MSNLDKLDSLIKFNGSGECNLTEKDVDSLLPKGITREQLNEVDKFKSELSSAVSGKFGETSDAFFADVEDASSTYLNMKISEYSEIESKGTRGEGDTHVYHTGLTNFFPSMKSIFSGAEEKDEQLD